MYSRAAAARYADDPIDVSRFISPAMSTLSTRLHRLAHETHVREEPRTWSFEGLLGAVTCSEMADSSVILLVSRPTIM